MFVESEVSQVKLSSNERIPTVEDFASLVAETTKIPIENQRLIFKGETVNLCFLFIMQYNFIDLRHRNSLLVGLQDKDSCWIMNLLIIELWCSWISCSHMRTRRSQSRTFISESSLSNQTVCREFIKLQLKNIVNNKVCSQSSKLKSWVFAVQLGQKTGKLWNLNGHPKLFLRWGWQFDNP